MSDVMHATARDLVAPGKGILAKARTRLSSRLEPPIFSPSSVAREVARTISAHPGTWGRPRMRLSWNEGPVMGTGRSRRVQAARVWGTAP